jgi:cytochrome bd-type quinol oxidase subunit 1
MSCGTPIIATNWSGVTAYLTELNGFPLAMEGLVDVK